MNEIRFEIPGYCQPKQRTFGHGFATPPETRAYEKLVKTLAKIAMRGNPPFMGYISLDIEIICEIPKSWPNKKKGLALEQQMFPTHCDIDNQIKALSDAMNGVVYMDDRFVNFVVAKRRYGRDERVVVIVRLIV